MTLIVLMLAVDAAADGAAGADSFLAVLYLVVAVLGLCSLGFFRGDVITGVCTVYMVDMTDLWCNSFLFPHSLLIAAWICARLLSSADISCFLLSAKRLCLTLFL